MPRTRLPQQRPFLVLTKAPHRGLYALLVCGQSKHGWQRAHRACEHQIAGSAHTGHTRHQMAGSTHRGQVSTAWWLHVHACHVRTSRDACACTGHVCATPDADTLPSSSEASSSSSAAAPALVVPLADLACCGRHAWGGTHACTPHSHSVREARGSAHAAHASPS